MAAVDAAARRPTAQSAQPGAVGAGGPGVRAGRACWDSNPTGDNGGCHHGPRLHPGRPPHGTPAGQLDSDSECRADGHRIHLLQRGLPGVPGRVGAGLVPAGGHPPTSSGSRRRAALDCFADGHVLAGSKVRPLGPAGVGVFPVESRHVGTDSPRIGRSRLRGVLRLVSPAPVRRFDPLWCECRLRPMEHGRHSWRAYRVQ